MRENLRVKSDFMRENLRAKSDFPQSYLKVHMIRYLQTGSAFGGRSVSFGQLQSKTKFCQVLPSVKR